jgi:predicted protein tyrosine phosphatase
MAGKGDKLRKGANLKAYYDNYDKIFGKKEMKTDIPVKTVINVPRHTLHHHELPKEAQNFYDWAWISIEEPDTPETRVIHEYLDQVPNLKMSFWDVTSPYQYGGETYEPLCVEQAEQLVDFLVENKEKNIVVNCRAGVSRSGAIAQFCQDFLGHKWLPKYKMMAVPNSKVYRYMVDYYQRKYLNSF